MGPVLVRRWIGRRARAYLRARRARTTEHAAVSGHLDDVKARIVLIEMMRDTAPEIESLSWDLVNDCYDIALGLTFELSKEIVARARREGSGGEHSPRGGTLS